MSESETSSLRRRITELEGEVKRLNEYILTLTNPPDLPELSEKILSLIAERYEQNEQGVSKMELFNQISAERIEISYHLNVLISDYHIVREGADPNGKSYHLARKGIDYVMKKHLY